ncbi:hypothetical protein E2C01_024435 [Portunus trituberculatus]|uniref:Gustatory receptor n=1 Tax=Portunus trituberculatus TaxID=210409 RepID=A0A5B7ED60_PORTR|nr:hypothetical protein [Portunus trituberculatus]
MGSSHSYFVLLLKGMRLTGAFPFVEKRKGKPLEEAKHNHLHSPETATQPPTLISHVSLAGHGVFQVSPFWTCWALIVGVAGILVFALGWWELVKDQSIGFPHYMESTYYAFKINEVLDIITMAVLMVYVFCKRALLRQVIEICYNIIRGRDNDPALPNFPFVMTIPLILNLTCALIIIVSVIYNELMSVRVIIAVMQELSFYLLGLNILTLLQMVNFLTTNEYDCVIASLHTCLAHASRHPHTHHHHEYQHITGKVLGVFRSNAVHHSSVWAEVIHTVNKPANLSEIDHRLLDAKERLTQAHQLVRLASEYCGVPVTMLMFFSVVTCIFSLFFSSFVTELATYDKILIFTFALNSLVTIIYLCNVPHSVREKVRNAAVCPLC